MSVSTEDRSLIGVGFENSRILRGFLAIVLGILAMFIGLVLHNILDMLSAPWYAVMPFGLMFYLGIAVAVVSPVWYWIGRPLYYMNKHR